MFHTIVELLSIIVAFTVFIVTWNSRSVLDNNYLYFVGISYFFIGSLDLLHTLTFKGMNIIVSPNHYANQFWVATRLMEALTLFVGFYFLKYRKKLNLDILFISYLSISVFITLSILYWENFPVCYIDGVGQTSFKVYAEFVIIAVLLLSGSLLYWRKKYFNRLVLNLLAASIFITILSEVCFTLYFQNDSYLNALGHLFKVLSFYLIYKANVETGFTQPTALLFKGLNDSEVRYRTLASNLPVLIFRFNQYFECTYSNYEELATLNQIQLNNLLSKIKVYLKEVKSTDESLKINVRLVEDDTTYIYALDIIIENHTDYKAQTYLILCQDISKMKLAEEQLIELNATKDKFFSIIAHDLKNPFTTILASSELISRSGDKLSDEKIQSLAQRTNESAKNAFLLLENLLEWSRVQTGILTPNPEVIQINELLANVLKNVNSIALSKNINLIINDAASVSCFADLNMTMTIFRNLISNAIKFSYPDSKIIISSYEEQHYVVFSVADEGTGIDEENLKNLLISNSGYIRQGTAKEKGTGLGLQLCKDFINLNGGDFWVESELGKGSNFKFSLPKYQ